MEKDTAMRAFWWADDYGGSCRLEVLLSLMQEMLSIGDK